MQNEQTKNFWVNIITGVVIIGVIATGYFVFTQKNQPASSSSSTINVSQIASETAFVGAEIESTVKDLEDLKQAVANSAIIFRSTAFQNLEDFTAPVSIVPVGRPNPFLPTDWKLKLEAVQNTASSQKVSSPGI